MHFNHLTPLYSKQNGIIPFRRGAFERRSLRYHSRPVSVKAHPAIPRTSLDLELDLRAQQTKLKNLNEEIKRLRELKQR